MNVALFPGMSHAQAQKVLRQLNAHLVQDGRGGLRLVPAIGPRPYHTASKPPEPPEAA